MSLFLLGTILVVGAIVTGIVFLLLVTSATDDPDPKYSLPDRRDGLGSDR